MSILSALMSGNPAQLVKALKPDPDLRALQPVNDGTRRAAAASDPDTPLGIPVWIWIVGGIIGLMLLTRKSIGRGYRSVRSRFAGSYARFRRRFSRRRR